MTPDQYVNDRLDEQANWYDGKSATNKKWFISLRVVEIVAAALVPFLSGYVRPEAPQFLIFIGGLGVLIAVCAAAISLFQFQENWIKYRTTAESLKKEKFLFLTRVEPYDNDETAYSTLVQRVETLISQENTNWAQYMTKPEED